MNMGLHGLLVGIAISLPFCGMGGGNVVWRTCQKEKYNGYEQENCPPFPRPPLEVEITEMRFE